MKQLNSDTFQELHHAPKEYCRESGPLNSKEGSFPALLNGLELVAAALAALALLNTLLSLSIVSSPLSILSNRAYIEVDVRNWPDEGDLTYILTPADDPERILTSGEIFSDPQDLELEGLTSETEYILTFFHNDEVVGDYSFSTGSDQPTPTNPTTEPTTSPTTIPTTAPTTVPTTEPTTAPTTEPVTVPTTPPTTRPTNPPEPEPEPEPEPSPITGTAQVLDVYKLGADGELYGFIFFEQHTFTDVPEPSEIKITQGGEYLIENYGEYYDPATKTLTITFGDSLIPPGEAVTSLVSVTFSDGSVGESTEVLCAPKFNSLDLSISPSATDVGHVDFHFSGTWVLPSIGEITNLQVEIWPDMNDEGDPFTEDLSASGSQLTESFGFTVGVTMDYPAAPMTAFARVFFDWSFNGKSFTFSDDVTATFGGTEVTESTESSEVIPEVPTTGDNPEISTHENINETTEADSESNSADSAEATDATVQPGPTETVIPTS